ncbi:hypothetical protein [Streptomyces acidicola]|uniref:hypothetical protein n=1 Tax=Streptomyces acidicola TaxID=2596892 RepID=UPI003814B10E
MDEAVDQTSAGVLGDESAGEDGGAERHGQLPGVALTTGPYEEAVHARAAGGVLVQQASMRSWVPAFSGKFWLLSQLSSWIAYVT